MTQTLYAHMNNKKKQSNPTASGQVLLSKKLTLTPAAEQSALS
jgi:hypothetical protein